MKKSAKKSPLEKLAEIATEQSLPVKVEPKSRFKEEEILTPIIEEDALEMLTQIPQMPAGMGQIPEQIVIANSSLNLNFNFNVDDKAVDRVIEGSKQAFKGIAAAGAAMLGASFLLSNNKKVDKVKIPLMPKIKIPKNKKS